MSDEDRSTARRSWAWLVALMALAALACAAALAPLMNIRERKQEALQPYFPVVEISEDVSDPAEWGKNFPRQYDSYRRTVDHVRTRFGGSEARPRTPTDADPRASVYRSRLEDDSRLKTMWSGYSFALDFRKKRGHAYMLDDQTFTARQKAAQFGNCVSCHASTIGA